MEKRKIKIGIICYDLQNFTADFINRLQNEVMDFAIIKAYPIMNNIGDIKINFLYTEGDRFSKHKVKTYSDNKNHTPEGILITPNTKNAIKCAIESDLIIHYGIFSSTALISGCLGYILQKKQISVNQTLPVNWEIKRKWWIKLNKKIFFKFCSLHIAQSKISISNLIEVYKIKNTLIKYIPFEAGVHNFNEKYNKIISRKHTTPIKDNNEYSFLFVGSLYRFKGYALAIEAIKLLRARTNLNIKLTIVGPEPIEKSEPRISDIKLHIKSIGLEDYIDILGSKSLDELVNIYHQSDVFILPTMKDCFPKVLVEAGVLGKPLITSDACGAIDTIVIDGVNGYICEAGSKESLAHCMEKMCNREIVNKMSLETKSIINKYMSDTANEAMLFMEAIKTII